MVGLFLQERGIRSKKQAKGMGEIRLKSLTSFLLPILSRNRAEIYAILPFFSIRRRE
jgi:hypothetical protein